MGVACWYRPYIENDYLLVWSATETRSGKVADGLRTAEFTLEHGSGAASSECGAEQSASECGDYSHA